MKNSHAVSIRRATVDDVAIIAQFNLALARETEDRVLDSARVQAGVAALLADEQKGRYWVAISDDRVVGQIMITTEWSDWRNGTMWWIQSVYVDADHRRRGIFSALHRHVESLARSDSQCIGIRLYVEHENARAQKTYVSLDFRKPGYEVMEIDFREMADEGARQC